MSLCVCVYTNTHANAAWRRLLWSSNVRVTGRERQCDENNLAATTLYTLNTHIKPRRTLLCNHAAWWSWHPRHSKPRWQEGGVTSQRCHHLHPCIMFAKNTCILCSPRMHVYKHACVSSHTFCGVVQAAAMAKGEEMAELEMQKMTEQMGDFKSNLQDFAIKHRKVQMSRVHLVDNCPLYGSPCAHTFVLVL